MKKVLCPIIIGFLFACAHPQIGKQLPPGNYERISGLNHHTVMLKHLTIEFDHSINQVKNTITFDGVVRFRKDQLDSAGWELNELWIEVYFLDRNRKVINVKSFCLMPMRNILEPIPFKKTFPYDSRYSFVTFAYEGKIWM